MRRPAMLLIVALLAACSSDSTVDTTSAVGLEAPSTTSYTTLVVETTTEAVGQVDVCGGSALRWEVGSIYSVGCFLVPLSFVPLDDGWSAYGATSDWVHLRWFEPSIANEAVTVTLLAFRSSSEPAAVLDAMLKRSGLRPVSEVGEAQIGVRAALKLDIEGLPNESSSPNASECSRSSGLVPKYGTGWDLGVASDLYNYGFGACSMSRVWVVDATGTSVSVLASTLLTDRFDELMPVVERLLDSIAFEAP